MLPLTLCSQWYWLVCQINSKKEPLESCFLEVLILMCLSWHVCTGNVMKSVLHFCLSSSCMRVASPNCVLWLLLTWSLRLVLVFPAVIYSGVRIFNTLNIYNTLF
jgi:hypothetical protein